MSDEKKPAARKTNSRVPTPERELLVMALVAGRLSEEMIARQLKITTKQLRQHYSHQLRHGAENLAAKIVVRQVQNALSGKDRVVTRNAFRELVGGFQRVIKETVTPTQSSTAATEPSQTTIPFRLELADPMIRAEISRRHLERGKPDPFAE